MAPRAKSQTLGLKVCSIGGNCAGSCKPGQLPKAGEVMEPKGEPMTATLLR